MATLTQVRETTRFLEAGSHSARLAVNRDTAYSPRCYAFTRHQRLTTLAASAGCWHAGPLGVSSVLTLAPRYSPWRLTATPARVTNGSGRPETWRAISLVMHGFLVRVSCHRRRA